MNMKEILFDIIQRRRNYSDQYVLFLGAGASLSSGMPMFSTLFEVAKAKNYAEFSEVFDSIGPSERYVLLEPHLRVRQPSLATLMFAELVRDGYFSSILTTNFDTLIEHALQDVGVRPDDYQVLINEPDHPIIDFEKFLDYGEPLIKIVKLHGDLGRRRYALTQQETFEFAKPIEETLRRIFRTRDVIIVGSNFVDLDLLKTMERKGGSIWYVNPQEPDGHIKTIMAARGHTRNTVSGDAGKFDVFVNDLHHFLLPSKAFTVEWTLLAPFFTGMSFDDAKCHLDAEGTPANIEACHLVRFLEFPDIELHWFDFGVGVWVLRETAAFDSVTEFSTQRRKRYREMISGNHAIRRKAVDVLNCLNPHIALNEEGVPLSYALSLVNVISPAWPDKQIANALKLLAWPSLLRENLDDPSEEDRQLVIAQEKEYLNEGFQEDVFTSFCIDGAQKAFATWSGVAILIQDARRTLTIDEMLNYEIELQACWLYLDRMTQELTRSGNRAVREQYLGSSIRGRLLRLVKIDPGEHSFRRLFKDAIIKTSQITEKQQQFTDILHGELDE